MPSTRRVVSRNSDVWRRLDARRSVVGVVVAESRPQRRAGHEKGHDQGDGELHGVVRQARRQARRRLNRSSASAIRFVQFLVCAEKAQTSLTLAYFFLPLFRDLMCSPAQK